MARAGEYHDAFLVIKGAHALAALRDDGGRSDSLQGHAAFFADGPEAMEIHLVADGVDFVHDGLLSAGSNWSVGVMEGWNSESRQHSEASPNNQYSNTPVLDHSRIYFFDCAFAFS